MNATVLGPEDEAFSRKSLKARRSDSGRDRGHRPRQKPAACKVWGNKTGVVGRGRQLARLVAGIADDQRDALLVGLLRQGRRRCGQEQKDGEKEDRP
jgi:hypothetical protein